MGVTKTAAEQTRAEDDLLVSQCNLVSLQKSWPLRWPTPAEIPCSPKKRYRSAYVYAWQTELADPVQLLTWKNLSNFDLLLRLVDFNGLRPVLAHLLGWKSGRGWEPFDPVSFFLLAIWQISNRWERSQTLKNLADERYADYADYFGFRKGVYPTEGGMRYFLTTLGHNSDANPESISVQQGEDIIQIEIQKLNLLLVEAVGIMRQVPVLSPKSWEEALLCPDGCAVSLSLQAVTSLAHPKIRGLAMPKTKNAAAATAILWPVHRFAARPPHGTGMRVTSGIPVPTNPQITQTIRPVPMQSNTTVEKPAMVTAVCLCAWPTHSDASVSLSWMMCAPPTGMKIFPVPPCFYSSRPITLIYTWMPWLEMLGLVLMFICMLSMLRSTPGA
jgi:hypothetical protein